MVRSFTKVFLGIFLFTFWPYILFALESVYCIWHPTPSMTYGLACSLAWVPFTLFGLLLIACFFIVLVTFYGFLFSNLCIIRSLTKIPLLNRGFFISLFYLVVFKPVILIYLKK